MKKPRVFFSDFISHLWNFVVFANFENWMKTIWDVFWNLEKLWKMWKICGDTYLHEPPPPPIFYILCGLGWGVFLMNFMNTCEFVWIEIEILILFYFWKKKFRKIQINWKDSNWCGFFYYYCVIVFIFGDFWYEFDYRQNWSMNHLNDINLGKLRRPIST